MKKKQNKIDRRNFLKTVGAAGLGSALAGMRPVAASAQETTGQKEAKASGEAQETKSPQVPKRKLGKTGADVPCLSQGSNFSLMDKQIVLRKGLECGVNCWDTANSYGGGNSELGIGKFLSKNQELRKELFIISKASRAKNAADVEKLLQTSLKRMNTKYIDLYCGVHILSDPGQLTDELKQWAESAKKRKLIRFFGFSTHSNMAKHLAAAAKLDWIDAIITSYNYRLLQDDEMQAAIEACHKAGIGLIAIKTLGRDQRGGRGRPPRRGGPEGGPGGAGQRAPRGGPGGAGQRPPVGGPGGSAEAEEDKKLLAHFLERGLTEEQAKIKAVLQNKYISSACVGMQSATELTSNVEAVLNETKLTQTDMDVLRQHAAATCSGYCAGCAHICNSALPDVPCVNDIMRYLMYYNSYGDKAAARELFAQIPGRVRGKLLSTDYSVAEARCPQHMPIGELVAEAVHKLA